MSALSQTVPSSSSTTTTSVPNVHVLQLSLLAASLESVVDIVDRYDSLLFSIKIPKSSTSRIFQIEIAEVVKGRILSTTRPEWIYMPIRQLIREAYRNSWIVSRLDL